ncbi:hypothetical protein L1276_002645 [Flavobacterium sp. HSC-32F16]|uniref:hypothetical protein n=1 Tax=Flavobacterium sp. HSC-32F16 TaxID=2910964 RepID=UPI0020A554B8|nr:hypothetical protein [Flavobacterium sp. HSC-32F16]MCP2027488.1 hypothetical protein [Flavobacterium sp. HSC-32F16]
MDFLQIIAGRYLLELLGAFARFIYLNTVILFNDDDFILFSEIWSPKGKINKKEDNSNLNHMIGVIVFGSMIFLLVIFTT